MSTYQNLLPTEKQLNVKNLLGLSQDGYTEKIKERALNVTVKNRDTAVETFFYLHIISTESDYEKFVSMSASAKVKAGFARASGKVSFTELSRRSSYELIVIAQVSVKLPAYQTDETSLDDTFWSYIYKRPELIDDKYGLSYINEAIYGGECLIRFIIKADSNEHFQQLSASFKGKAGPISGKASFSQTIQEISKNYTSSLMIFENGRQIPDMTLPAVVDHAYNFPSTINEQNCALLEYSTDNLKSIADIKDLDYNSLFDLDFKNDQRQKLYLANDLFERAISWADDANYVVNNPNEFDEATKNKAAIDLELIKEKKETIRLYIYNCRNIGNNGYLSKIDECKFTITGYKRKAPIPIPINHPIAITVPTIPHEPSSNNAGGRG